MDILKKYSLYKEYKKFLRSNKSILETKFNIRVDNASRMYTVVNIPPDIDGVYTMKKSDMDVIASTYIRDYVSGISKFFINEGVHEIIDYYDEVRSVSRGSYLIIFGYKYFRTDEVVSRVRKLSLYFAVVIILYFLFQKIYSHFLSMDVDVTMVIVFAVAMLSFSFFYLIKPMIKKNIIR